MKQISITSFDELIEFIKTQNAPMKDIFKIVSETVGVKVFFTSHDDKELLITDLNHYWNAYKNRPIHNRPIMLTPFNFNI